MSVMLITGMHRSGTTHLGKLISASNPKHKSVHEPLNMKLGIRDVDIWYPSSTDLSFRGLNIESFVTSIIKLDVKPKYWPRLPSESFARTIGRRIFGGEFIRSLRKAKSSIDSSFIIKDPFCIKLVDEFSSHNVKCLLIYKNPLSNLVSIKRQNWAVNESEFSEDFLNHKNKYSDKLAKYFDEEEINSLCLWAYLHNELPQDPSIILIDHVDYCRGPVEIVKHLWSQGFIEDIDAAIQYVKSTMLVERTNRSDGLHDFVRNSSELSESWREQFTSAQIDCVEDLFFETLSGLESRKVKI
ncbi:sulfotransferase domain-containing protein [Ferrimonas balearica]|uniref:sulfotransferase domain-containing protein n=1 Tax=Ferrimonas balearica TaxID=44012 RepID=UPI001C58B13F|nr:sulfotransferase domain-containing protein [Ferrimonas balearica]MBW3164227.1 sulfotransferase domain-containing protein [Ferrimonas balearica]